MKTYEFTLIIPEINDQKADAIYEACPDSSVGKSNGIMYVAFDREAQTFEEALESAVSELRELGVSPSRVEMDVPELTAV